jgi:quercetin dioxygenase-like cupin family protein
MELDVGQGVLLGPGEGERLGERIVVKIERPELSVNEVTVHGFFEGAGPHFHRGHVDAFYVIEGEVEFTVGTETVLARAGTSVVIPPKIVHAFCVPGPGDTRYLNFHAPDSDFIEYLRRRTAGEDFEWDSVSVAEPSGPADAIVAGPDEGERLERRFLENVIRAETPEISLFELTFDETWEGVDPHSHDDHVDSFFVLDGEVDFLLEDDTVRAGVDSYVAAPPHVTHGFRPVAPARFLNIHAPDAGFAARARGRR